MREALTLRDRALASMLMTLAVSCTHAAPKSEGRGPRARASSSSTPSLTPREASAFVCEGKLCLQRHVRLPDDGEWRCAERGAVAWCAGGEPPAGVATAEAARGYVCGNRKGSGRPERVCVDQKPDYPNIAGRSYTCRFVQERGLMRECREVGSAPLAFALAKGGSPDCWLDSDCPSQRCDRGTCLGAAE